MKAISLWQPWASLIACGAKTIETRSWPAPSTVVGARIAIHAAKTKQGIWLATSDEDLIGELIELFPEGPDLLPRGALVATAVVEASLPVERLDPDVYGDFSPGRCGWILSGIEALAEPIPWRGRQGVFEVPAEALGAAEAPAEKQDELFG